MMLAGLAGATAAGTSSDVLRWAEEAVTVAVISCGGVGLVAVLVSITGAAAGICAVGALRIGCPHPELSSAAGSPALLTLLLRLRS